jgi:hypothetical protein
MARNAARLKMGYFPLPEVEAHKIRSLLSFPGPCSVVDPCAGKGTALDLITAGDVEVPVRQHQVEGDFAKTGSFGDSLFIGTSIVSAAHKESLCFP